MMYTYKRGVREIQKLDAWQELFKISPMLNHAKSLSDKLQTTAEQGWKKAAASLGKFGTFAQAGARQPATVDASPVATSPFSFSPAPKGSH